MQPSQTTEDKPMSEGIAFRSVTFGGFHKKDVMTYISDTTRRYQEDIRRRDEELAQLREQLCDDSAMEEAAAENRALRERVEQLEEQLSAQSDHAADVAQLKATCQQKLSELEEDYQSRLEQQREQLEAYRQDAEAYRVARDRIGQIEMQARVHAIQVEQQADAQAAETISSAQAKHDNIIGSIRSEAESLHAQLDQLLNQVCSSFDSVHSDVNTSIAKAMQEVDHVHDLLLNLGSCMEESADAVHNLDVPPLPALDELEAEVGQKEVSA